MKNVGMRLRGEREQRKISLTKLAKNAGISKSLLSQIEREEVVPSLASLDKITRALDIQLRDIFNIEENEINESDIIVRKDKRKQVVIPGAPFKYELLVPNLKRKMELSIVDMEPLSKIDNQSFFQHEGEEIIFLLKGKLILYVDNKKYELYEGDSAAFDSKLPHWLENETEEYITYITAMTPVFL